MAYEKAKKARADAARWLRIKEEMSTKRKIQRLATRPVARNGDPSREELLKCIEQGYCWWCQKGGFRRLAGHTWRVHGIYADDIRRMAVLLKHTPTCTPGESEYLSILRFRLLKEGRAKLPIPHNTGRKTEYSEAGLISARNNQRHMMESITPEMQRRAVEKAIEKTAKPHPCPVCGTIVPRAHPICCSEGCRKQAIKDAARRVGLSLPQEHFVRMGEIIRQKYSKTHRCRVCGKLIRKSRPRQYCSPECAHNPFGLPVDEIKGRYLSGESSTDIAKSYGCCDHTIRRQLRKVGVAIRPDSSGRYNN